MEGTPMGQMTKAIADARLVARRKAWMARVGMSILIDGTNPDTADPLADALAEMGLSLSSFALGVRDVDLALVGDNRAREFLMRAELRLLWSILGNQDRVSQRVGNQSGFDWRDLNAAIQAAIKALEARIEAEFGLLAGGTGLAALSVPAADPREINDGWGLWNQGPSGGFGVNLP
jgi:hypothetical protein